MKLMNMKQVMRNYLKKNEISDEEEFHSDYESNKDD